MRNNKGYTLIEIIIAIVIMGIIIFPIAGGYQALLTAMGNGSDLSKAVRLSELEFSIVNSLDYDSTTMTSGYDNTTVNYYNSGYTLRRRVEYRSGNNSSLQSLKAITVWIYRNGDPRKIILTTQTFRENNVFFGP
jgi:prepilin-type N-terminal cleavage/methylation domain-containing protein